MREPFNCISHLIAALMGLYFTLYFARRRHFEMFPFTLAVIFCYLCSALYHGSYSYEQIFQRLDYIGIFALIAGTYTPILPPKLLKIVWSCVCVCISVQILPFVEIPFNLLTVIYLGVGWMTFFYLPTLRKRYGWNLTHLIGGGIVYSVAAILNSQQIIWHEVFHVLVAVGSWQHFLFLRNTVSEHYGNPPRPHRS